MNLVRQFVYIPFFVRCIQYFCTQFVHRIIVFKDIFLIDIFLGNCFAHVKLLSLCGSDSKMVKRHS